MADSTTRFIDNAKLEVSTGTSTLTMANADFTTWQPFLTITPDGSTGLKRVRVVIDLAKATTGFAAVFAAQTIQFSVARKVDGTNYRTGNNTITTAISGTNSAGMGIDLDVGDVGPSEVCQIQVKLSAETGTSVQFPYVVYYQAGTRATLTPST